MGRSYTRVITNRPKVADSFGQNSPLPVSVGNTWIQHTGFTIAIESLVHEASLLRLFPQFEPLGIISIQVCRHDTQLEHFVSLTEITVGRYQDGPRGSCSGFDANDFLHSIDSQLYLLVNVCLRTFAYQILDLRGEHGLSTRTPLR